MIPGVGAPLIIRLGLSMALFCLIVVGDPEVGHQSSPAGDDPKAWLVSYQGVLGFAHGIDLTPFDTKELSDFISPNQQINPTHIPSGNVQPHFMQEDRIG